jgi:hypothetical protein
VPASHNNAVRWKGTGPLNVSGQGATGSKLCGLPSENISVVSTHPFRITRTPVRTERKKERKKETQQCQNRKVESTHFKFHTVCSSYVQLGMF